jgi:hypothetical protein
MFARLSSVDVANDVYLFGYPLSLTMHLSDQFELFRPLLRKGIVAGVNQATRTIIVDCPSYQGNSGGPIIQVTNPAFNIKDFRIIGIVTGFIPFEEEWENKQFGFSNRSVSNSGYSIVEPIDIALELVWK